MALVCFVGGLSPWNGTNSQKATHLCRGSGAASEGKPRSFCGDLSLRSLGYLLFENLSWLDQNHGLRGLRNDHRESIPGFATAFCCFSRLRVASPLARAPDRTSSAVATGVIRAAPTRSSADNIRLEVFRRAGVVRVFVLARLVVIHRFYSERVVISAEVGVNGCRPLPIHTYPKRIRSNDAAPSNILKSARNSHRNQVRKRGEERIPRKSGCGDASHWHSANKRGRSRARRGIEDDGCVWH